MPLSWNEIRLRASNEEGNREQGSGIRVPVRKFQAQPESFLKNTN